MNENNLTRSDTYSTGIKPHIERTQHHLKRLVPKHGHGHPSLEFTFDPNELVRGQSEIIPAASIASWADRA